MTLRHAGKMTLAYLLFAIAITLRAINLAIQVPIFLVLWAMQWIIFGAFVVFSRFGMWAYSLGRAR